MPWLSSAEGFHVSAVQTSSSTGAVPLPPLDPIQRYTIPEAARYLRIGVSTVWRDIAAGRIAAIRYGGRRYVPGSEIVRLSATAA